MAMFACVYICTSANVSNSHTISGMLFDQATGQAHRLFTAVHLLCDGLCLCIHAVAPFARQLNRVQHVLVGWKAQSILASL